MISDIEPVDIHVGNRVRTRRRFLGLSQTDLAIACQITFQQIQKYERGANRISASRLVQIGRVLGVTPGWFFVGIDGMPGDPPLAEGEAARIAVAQDYDVAVLLDRLAVMSHDARLLTARFFVVSLDHVDQVAAARRGRGNGVLIRTAAEQVSA